MAHFGWHGGVEGAVRWSYTIESVMREGKIMAHEKLTILKKPSLLSHGVNERFA